MKSAKGVAVGQVVIVLEAGKPIVTLKILAVCSSK